MIKLSTMYAKKGVKPLVSDTLNNYISPIDSDIYVKLQDVEFIDTEEEFGISDFSIKIKKGDQYELLPTFGRLSRYGLISGTDTLNYTSIGTDSLEELDELYHLLKGVSENDPTTYEDEFKVSGSVDFELDYKLIKAMYEVLLSVEVFSKTATIDGTLIGDGKEYSSLEEMYKSIRSGFKESTRSLILKGTYFSSEKGSVTYKKAESYRNNLKDYILPLLKEGIFQTQNEDIKILALVLGLPLLRAKDTYYLGYYFSEDCLLKEATND